MPWNSGNGLKLNVSLNDNSQDPDLAIEVAPLFRLSRNEAKRILSEMSLVVSQWPVEATRIGISRGEQLRMARAFRVGEQLLGR